MSGRRWISEEEKVLTDKFSNTPTSELAIELGRSYSQVAQHANSMGLKKSEQYMVQCFEKTNKSLVEAGKNNRFKKGGTPINKGKKQTEFMTVNGIERTKATRFKRGNMPHNTKYDGAIREQPDKSGKVYKMIRISLSNWELLHRHNWEKVNGAIPKGMILVCKSEDTLNCDPSNWELITRAENMKRNTVHNYPKEIAKTIQLLGAVKRQINKRKTNEK